MRRCKKVEKRETRGPRIFTRQKRAMFGKPVTVLFRPWEDKDQSPAEAAPSSLLTVPQTQTRGNNDQAAQFEQAENSDESS